MSLAGLLLLLVSTWFCIVLLGCVRSATRPPEGTAVDFLEGPRPDGQVVACLGDSITHGRVGADWVASLRSEMGSAGFSFVNEGVNSEVAMQLRRRLEPIIACDPDLVVILIGTNDVMGSLDAVDGARYRRMGDLPDAPSFETFTAELEGILEALTTRTRARVAVCSLPPLGEVHGSPSNAQVDRFNRAIVDLAAAAEVHVLPLHERLVAALESDGAVAPLRQDYRPGVVKVLRIVATVWLHYAWGRSWDEIAARRGLRLLPDHIHLGDRAGRLLAELVRDFVRDQRFS